MELPTLYKKTNTGAIQYWQIIVTEDGLGHGFTTTQYGQVGTDNPQCTTDRISEGKNIGKVNETTPYQQACVEAKAKWTKQNKKGYVEDILRAEAGDDDTEGVSCMLAHKYGIVLNGEFIPDQNHKIKLPCAVQPKFDGIRCRSKEDSTLWSREQRSFTSVPHITEAIKEVFSDKAPEPDGELYNHEFKTNFDKIVSIVKQQKEVDPDHKLVQYHIYDLAIPGVPFIERNKMIKDALANHKGPLCAVETRIVNSHEELLVAFKDFLAAGYEGLIARNLDSMYENKRSYNLQKLKEFFEDEFDIIGVKEGKGKLKGHAIFVVKTEEGVKVDVKLEGDTGRLKEIWGNPSLWEGKQLTIRYQGYTKDRSLRFPVGKAIRDYE
jgi:ATP-dependent DNA ligase